MPPTPRLSRLSLPRQALVRVMQSVNYGSISNLTVLDGELSFDPASEVLVDIRLDEEVGPRTELEIPDFALCAEVCRLLAQIDAVTDGTIEKIVVHGGVPRRVTFRRPLNTFFTRKQ